nr:hypothetical protein [uncultured Eisenbergiella sp.]
MKKSIINDIGLYKTRLLSMLTEDADICGLLLNKEEFTQEEADSLLYSRIFPYLYINTQADNGTCLCFEVDVPQIPTGMIKDMKITVWSYSPLTQMQYEKDGYLGTRPDILADMIERKLHASSQFGIGQLRLESVTSNVLDNRYYGRQMIFTVPDFKTKG